MQKRILFLGAAPSQMPPLRYAREEGHYIITCDYLPENPGHRIADEWHNVSTTDKKGVLALARKLRVDAIVAYASDPAAPTAAYVAEKMGLPGNPCQSVLTLARKDLFRDFLKEHGFNVPRSASFREREQARAGLAQIGLPAFVKPVDSSGSKGVTRITDAAAFDTAFDHALRYSRAKKVVVEQAINRVGYQIDSDIFLLGGDVAFWVWGNQHQDRHCHEFVPIANSFPTSLSSELQQRALETVTRILKLLRFKHGAFNVEFIVDSNDNVWVIEIGPRNGGGSIPEVIRYATGVDLIKYTVDAALGLPCLGLATHPTQGYWSCYVIHALENGVFEGLWLSERVKPKVMEQDIYVKSGDEVRKFLGSNDALGIMILKFDCMDEMLGMLDNMERDIRAVVTDANT